MTIESEFPLLQPLSTTKSHPGLKCFLSRHDVLLKDAPVGHRHPRMHIPLEKLSSQAVEPLRGFRLIAVAGASESQAWQASVRLARVFRLQQVFQLEEPADQICSGIIATTHFDLLCQKGVD